MRMIGSWRSQVFKRRNLQPAPHVTILRLSRGGARERHRVEGGKRRRRREPHAMYSPDRVLAGLAFHVLVGKRRKIVRSLKRPCCSEEDLVVDCPMLIVPLREERTCEVTPDGRGLHRCRA